MAIGVINKKKKAEIETTYAPPVKQLGITAKTFSALADSLDVVYESYAKRTYSSGSVKNEGSTSTTIRISCTDFDAGHADIPLGASEVIKFKNMKINQISVPAAPINSGSVNISVIYISFAVAGEFTTTPEIYFS